VTKEEKRRKKILEQTNERVKRFKKNHNIKKFSVDLESGLYDEIRGFLKEIGVTQKDFIVESYYHLRDKGDF
jgi:hypothetical protein